MGAEIQTIDLTDAAKQLREKIQLAFVDSIPEEQWLAMIEGELKKFTTEQRKSQRHGDDIVTPAAFETLAQKMLLDHARLELEQRLKDNTVLLNGTTMQSVVIEWLEKNQQHLLQSFVEQALATLFTNMVAASMDGLESVVTRIVSTGVGIPDPDNPNHDRAGNWIG